MNDIEKNEVLIPLLGQDYHRVNVGLEKCELSIKGMSCAGCANYITKFGSDLPGVESISVGLISEAATVVFDPCKTNPSELAVKLAALGYEVLVKDNQLGCTLSFEISEFTSFVQAQREILKIIVPLPSVSVTFMNKESFTQFNLHFEPSVIGAREIFKHFQTVFPSTLLIKTKKSSDFRSVLEENFKRYFLVSFIMTIPIMFVSMSSWQIFEVVVIPGFHVSELIMFVLATIVQFYSARSFYINAYKALSHFTTNMDVLVVLGTSSAYFYSLLCILQNVITKSTKSMDMETHFFETTAMLITFVTLGKFLESIAKKKTTSAISALLELGSDTALLWKSKKTLKSKASEFTPSQEFEVIILDIELLELEDVLQVLPGSKIAADGIVLAGTSEVDESMLTGESRPVKKNIGSEVIGGTVNLTGSFFLRVTRLGSDSTLFKILKLVEEAQLKKAPIQVLVDKVSSIFIPTVVIIALITWTVWLVAVFLFGVTIPANEYKFVFCFKFGMSVLVVSCPCALGLATPTAVMVAIGIGAQHGILIKGGDSLQLADTVKTIVLDKTGTITSGNPSVFSFYLEKGVSEETFFLFVASLEQFSEHSFGKAIVKYRQECFKSDLIAIVKEFEAVPGYGVQGIIDKVSVKVGNLFFLQESQIIISEEATIWKCDQEKLGATVILVSFEFKLVGAIAIRDSLRPSSHESIQNLINLGIDVWMITGDETLPAEAVAAEVGIRPDRVLANVSPGEKAKKIAILQNESKAVAMVGDGINDSPALTQANLGIAIGSGTAVAIESASVILVRSDLADILTFLRLSHAAMQKIRANLFFSLGYNLIAIPLAAGVMYPNFGIKLPPSLAAFFMSMSSVAVVLSSLSLKLSTISLKL